MIIYQIEVDNRVKNHLKLSSNYITVKGVYKYDLMYVCLETYITFFERIGIEKRFVLKYFKIENRVKTEIDLKDLPYLSIKKQSNDSFYVDKVFCYRQNAILKIIIYICKSFYELSKYIYKKLKRKDKIRG